MADNSKTVFVRQLCWILSWGFGSTRHAQTRTETGLHNIPSGPRFESQVRYFKWKVKSVLFRSHIKISPIDNDHNTKALGLHVCLFYVARRFWSVLPYNVNVLKRTVWFLSFQWIALSVCAVNRLNPKELFLDLSLLEHYKQPNFLNLKLSSS